MIWKTNLTKLINIKYPIIMGAFGGWGKANFASKFSNAGGLGIIAALNFPNFDAFRTELKKMKNLTKKPFGINLSLPHTGFTPSNKTRTKQDYLRYVKIALDEGVKIFTTSGYKAKFIGDLIHQYKAFWFHKCVIMKHAMSAERDGADAVTIVGLEGTGFKNPLSNTTLVNITMANKLLEIPIIAAGGIGDARGFLSALFMGANAVCLGTALMLTEECPVASKIKKKWLNLDIFEKDFHDRIYTYNTKNFMAPSTAIAHRKQILTIEELVKNLIKKSEDILKKWGFNSNEIDISS